MVHTRSAHTASSTQLCSLLPSTCQQALFRFSPSPQAADAIMPECVGYQKQMDHFLYPEDISIVLAPSFCPLCTPPLPPPLSGRHGV